MHTPSPACRALILANAGQLPREFMHRPSEPSYEGLQEVFWGCAVGIARWLLNDPGHPDHIRVGRAGIPLVIPPAVWEAMRAELGLNSPQVRAVAAAVLAADLGRDTSDFQSEPRLSGIAPPELLGFLLIGSHLFSRSRAGMVQFGYDDGVLTTAARAHPLAGLLGSFDASEVGREFARYSGLRPHRSSALRTAHHGYIRPIMTWLGLTSKATPADPPLDPGFLLRGLRDRPPTRNAPDWVALDGEVLDELNRLRSENDALRGASISSALAELLGPVLSAEDDPRAAAEQAGPGSDLASRLMLALISFLRHPAVAPFGAIGEVVSGEVLPPEYQIDPATPVGRFPPPAYRVSRRGLRLNGTTVLPALVIPHREPRL